jgi:hypothetical protein
MKFTLVILFLMTLSGLSPVAMAFEPNYQRDCTARFIPQDHFQIYQSAETKEITDNTGIRFMELTEKTVFEVQGITFLPALTSEKKTFSKRISQFLKIFPVSLLQKNSDVCFVFVKNFKEAAAINILNIIVIATDDQIWNRTIAHEFLHAIDRLHGPESNLKDWITINKNAGCEYKDVSSRVLKPGFPDVNTCWVSPYAQTDIMEDRAELFSAMVEDYPLLLKKIKDKPVMDSKISALKNYLKILSPEMDEDYWLNHSDSHSSWDGF